MNERKLSKSELAKREDIILNMKANKRDLVKKYGADAEKVMYGRATNMAKKQSESMNQTNVKLKEMVKDALKNPKKADLNKDGKLSDYEETRGKAVEKNLSEYKDEDVVKYKGEDHVITKRDGDKIYLRRKEDAVVLGKMPEFWVKSQDINENEDAEPTKSDIKKTKGLAKAKEELALLTREMKSLAKKYSKAEGADKEKLVKILKDKTKLKKELENILDKKKI
jgi:hypothetical protein